VHICGITRFVETGRATGRIIKKFEQDGERHMCIELQAGDRRGQTELIRGALVALA
jgi:hypothetical protein